jgi:hypothetical protein
MKKSNSEPKGHDTEDSGYSQMNIHGISPFLDPIISKKRSSLDELLVNRANREAKIFRDSVPSLKGVPWF